MANIYKKLYKFFQKVFVYHGLVTKKECRDLCYLGQLPDLNNIKSTYKRGHWLPT